MAIFAALAYFGGWKRFAIAAVLALIAGPKILLLMPIWFLGVWTYRRTKKGAADFRTGLALSWQHPRLRPVPRQRTAGGVAGRH